MDTPAKTAEDIIGIVPHTLGYTPTGSLVAIIVVSDGQGVTSCGTTLRVDFDAETAAMTLAEGGRWLRDLVCRACDPSGVFLILYDEEYLDDGDCGVEDAEDRSEAEYAAMHRGLIRAATDELAASLDAAGIATLSAWWVSGGRFGRIDDPESRGHDLGDAFSSACATELIATGSAPAASPAELVVRPADAEARAAFRGDSHPSPPSVSAAFDSLAEVYPRLLELRAGADSFDREALAHLMTPRTVSALDRILAEKWARDALEMILSFDHPDFPPKRVCRCGPGDLATRARRFGTSRLAAEQMIGLSSRAPRPRDILLAIAFLETYVPWGAPGVRATAYGVIAWFEWSLGGSTMAEQYALAALAVDPEHTMAGLLVSAVRAGHLPQWLGSGQSLRR